MYSPNKTRHTQATLYKTDRDIYMVNLPSYVSRSVFSKNRKRINLYLSVNQQNASIKALDHLTNIQALIASEDWLGLMNYETSLKPRKIIQGNFTQRSLKSLWHEYVKVKTPSWELSYLENDIKQTSLLLENAPNINLDEDLNPLIDYFMENRTVKATKRYLKQVSACLTWGKRRKLVKENPLPDFLKTLPTKKRNESDNDINPFSLEERNKIIQALRYGTFERYKDSHIKYADYVEFSFYTGARTSEILGLRWEHINFERNYIIFQEALVLATNGASDTAKQKKGLKTQKQRVFPLNDRLVRMLKHRQETTNAKLEDNVFNDINHNVFRTGVYKYVLKKLNIDYRKPYQFRHTFITIMANDSSLKLHQIAQICGTSINVIENHYLSNTTSIFSLPEI